MINSVIEVGHKIVSWIDYIVPGTLIIISIFITALGIRFVGGKVSKILAKEFGSLDNLKKANVDDLVNIKDIGERTALSVVNYFKDNEELISKLINHGVNVCK